MKLQILYFLLLISFILTSAPESLVFGFTGVASELHASQVAIKINPVLSEEVKNY